MPQTLRDGGHGIDVAILDQNGELVSAQAREDVGASQRRLQDRCRLPQKIVARGVAAGIVDDLELIDIQQHQNVLRAGLLEPVERSLEPLLERAAIGEARQCIVRGLPGQAADQRLLVGHVMERKHRAGGFAVDGQRRGRERHRNAASVEADQ